VRSSRRVSRTARFRSGIVDARGTLDFVATPRATPVEATDEQISHVTWNADGLAPAIVQEAGTGQVLMLAWMNEESLRHTLSEGRTVFWSRSRQELWRKGDTSGDRQWVREAYYDCDGDTLLFVVEQEGRGACHTGERSCFFRAFGSDAS
jgi:phosphoribosyl-AMP cyclohydrolase/phosphoribosyl-ATP pyrophosphohydrolase/phosphoribosyl-AMP cyclohydrolase